MPKSIFLECPILIWFLQRLAEFASLIVSFVSLVSERFSQPHSYGSIDSQHCFKFCQGLILAHSLQWDMIFLWFLRRDPCVYLSKSFKIPWITHYGQIHSHLHVKQKYIISSSPCYTQVFFVDIPANIWLFEPESE